MDLHSQNAVGQRCEAVPAPRAAPQPLPGCTGRQCPVLTLLYFSFFLLLCSLITKGILVLTSVPGGLRCSLTYSSFHPCLFSNPQAGRDYQSGFFIQFTVQANVSHSSEVTYHSNTLCTKHSSQKASVTEITECGLLWSVPTPHAPLTAHGAHSTGSGP